MSIVILTAMLFTAIPCLAGKAAFGPAILKQAGEADANGTRALIAPYIFRSDQIGLALGVAGGISGFQKGQMSIGGTAYLSTDGAFSGIGVVNNHELFFSNRIFLDSLAIYENSPDLWIFDGPSEGTRGGSNDSNVDDRYRGRGNDTRLEATFKYIFPWGGAKDTPIATYALKDGLLVSGATGGEDWNPMKGGLTYFELTPFYRQQSVDDVIDGMQNYETAGGKIAIRYDNTDFPLNPTTGSKQRLQMSQGIGALTNDSSWTSIDFEYSKFISFGETEYARQQVLALGFWTAAVLSDNLPPSFEGATLGGLNRMRGFDNNRFWDKAAIYYSAEYRYIPKWNPFKNMTIAKVDWIQFIIFGELGRVAPMWSISELHQDMKYDAGVGVAALVNKYLGRIDTAFSPETWRIRVNIAQTF
ncbi:BamA/TamA family outer membrane protein [Maridesulfovibrio frigidus]|uniref:BamA/TamA family outer membrane protein n=1 Tax=Maridesulfovibrio frigidus TaxID=340956 RepID=UPI000AA712F6|nr:BamA/TamA family outer membrane protein [Maridesulfovibrio frigidus]